MKKKLYISRLFIKQGQGKYGPYVRVGVEDDGKWYSCFDDIERSYTKDWEEGQTIEVDVEQTTGKDGKTYWNIIKPEKKQSNELLEEILEGIKEIQKMLGGKVSETQKDFNVENDVIDPDDLPF